MSPDHRARAPRHGPLRALLPATLLTALGVAAVLVGVVLLTRLTGEPYAYFDTPPAESLAEPRYVGWAAHVAVLVGAAGAAAAVFAGLLVRRRAGRQTREAGFLLGMGAIAWVLVCDDLLQLHDWWLPRVVPLPGERAPVIVCAIVYVLLLAAVLWRSGRGVLARTDLPILLLAGAGLGVSLFVDLSVRPGLAHYHLIEDGSRLFGIAMLTLYLTRTGLRFAQEASARAAHDAAAPVPYPRTVADLTGQSPSVASPSVSSTGQRPAPPRTGRRAHRRTVGAPPPPRVARTVADLTAGLPRPRPAAPPADTRRGQAGEGAGAHGSGAHRRGEPRASRVGAPSGDRGWMSAGDPGDTRVPQPRPRTGEAGPVPRREPVGAPGGELASTTRQDPQEGAPPQPYRDRPETEPPGVPAAPLPQAHAGAGQPVGYAVDPSVVGYEGAERPVAVELPPGFGAEPDPDIPAVPRPRSEITLEPAGTTAEPAALPRQWPAVVPAAFEGRSPGSPDAAPQP